MPEQQGEELLHPVAHKQRQTSDFIEGGTEGDLDGDEEGVFKGDTDGHEEGVTEGDPDGLNEGVFEGDTDG